MNNRWLFDRPRTVGLPRRPEIGPYREAFYPVSKEQDTNAIKGGREE